MVRRRRVLGLMCAASCLAACTQRRPDPTSTAESTASVTTAAQKREDDFRWKERCAIAAERLDKIFAPPSRSTSNETSVSEVFYSPTRNSCICEVSVVGRGGKTGITNLLTLYDCLTREELGTAMMAIGGPDFDERIAAWKKRKDALK